MEWVCDAGVAAAVNPDADDAGTVVGAPEDVEAVGPGPRVAEGAAPEVLPLSFDVFIFVFYVVPNCGLCSLPGLLLHLRYSTLHAPMLLSNAEMVYDTEMVYNHLRLEAKTLEDTNSHSCFLSLSVDCSRLHTVFPQTLSTVIVHIFSILRTDPRGRSYDTNRYDLSVCLRRYRSTQMLP